MAAAVARTGAASLSSISSFSSRGSSSSSGNISDGAQSTGQLASAAPATRTAATMRIHSAGRQRQRGGGIRSSIRRQREAACCLRRQQQRPKDSSGSCACRPRTAGAAAAVTGHSGCATEQVHSRSSSGTAAAQCCRQWPAHRQAVVGVAARLSTAARCTADDGAHMPVAQYHETTNSETTNFRLLFRPGQEASSGSRLMSMGSQLLLGLLFKVSLLNDGFSSVLRLHSCMVPAYHGPPHAWSLPSGPGQPLRC